MNTLWLVLGSAALILIGAVVAFGVVLYWMMKLDAGQVALAAEVLRSKVASLQATLEIEVAELKRKVATLWGERDR